MALKLEEIYRATPAFLQNWLVSVEGWRIQKARYGGNYPEIAREVGKNATLKGEALWTLQRERLRLFLQNAEQSPFWARRFARYGVFVKSKDPAGELLKLPVLEKDEVKAHAAEIQIDKGQTLRTVHTSGTTGGGLIFKETLEAEHERWALWWRYRKDHGIQPDDLCAYFGGRSIVPLAQEKPPYWRYNRPGKQLMFSAYHLRAETAATYAAEIRRRAPTWMHGYPSMLSLFAAYVIDQGLNLGSSIRIVTIGAESLLPQQKKLIQQAFNCQVRQHYGLTESVANISECPNGKLHVDEDFSWVEFHPISGEPSMQIIGTNWSNMAFPLIRYNTGDRATLSGSACDCGRPGRIVADIDGRKEDSVILKSGARVGRLDHIFKDLIHVREAQIVQRADGSIVLRVVKGLRFDAEGEEAKLLHEARLRLGDEAIISVDYVETLARGKSGKLRFVVSEMKP